MAKLVKPGQITAQHGWVVGDIRQFAALMFDDANDHQLALAMWSLLAGDPDLACDFIQLDKRHSEAGSLTPELSLERDELVKRLDALNFQAPDIGV